MCEGEGETYFEGRMTGVREGGQDECEGEARCVCGGGWVCEDECVGVRGRMSVRRSVGASVIVDELKF